MKPTIDVAQIFVLQSRNLTLAQIAARLGITDSTVHYHLKRAGLTAKRRPCDFRASSLPPAPDELAVATAELREADRAAGEGAGT